MRLPLGNFIGNNKVQLNLVPSLPRDHNLARQAKIHNAPRSIEAYPETVLDNFSEFNSNILFCCKHPPRFYSKDDNVPILNCLCTNRATYFNVLLENGIQYIIHMLNYYSVFIQGKVISIHQDSVSTLGVRSINANTI